MAVLVECVAGKAFKELISPAICETISANDLQLMENAMSKSTDVWMVSDSGQMVGITGVAPDSLLAREAFIWNYTNPFNDRVSVGVMRATRQVVDHFLNQYPTLVGYCELPNAKAQRWVRWLGAEFGQLNGQLIPFMIKAKT